MRQNIYTIPVVATITQLTLFSCILMFCSLSSRTFSDLRGHARKSGTDRGNRFLSPPISA